MSKVEEMQKIKGQFTLNPLIVIALLSLYGCSDPPTYTPPKEGEMVTWKFNSQLVFKTKLGARREHIPDTHCPRCEAEFYRPQYDFYLGQFPIDYEPDRFEKLTTAEVDRLPEEASHLLDGLQFNLMLNGKKVKATDQHFGPYTLDDPNQVKVQITGCDRETIEAVKFAKKNGDPMPKNSKQYFESWLEQELDANTKRSKNGMECYGYKDIKLKGSQSCFVASEIASVSGSSFSIHPGIDGLQISSRSTEYKYGCMVITWRTHRKNVNSAKKIDAAIWRLLDAWNVSPNQ